MITGVAFTMAALVSKSTPSVTLGAGQLAGQEFAVTQCKYVQ